MFRVTVDWIHQNATEGHAWTKDQLEALGIRWPPKAGWILEARGRLITESQRLRFEQRLTKPEVRYGRVDTPDLFA